MSTDIQQQNFRRILQERLLESCRKNPNYSLRSFARFLNISPSALSAMLNGKRPITKKTQMRLAPVLGLSLSEILKPESHEIKKNSYHVMQLDIFAVTSDWYHFAILELTKTKNFKADATYISKRLGITKSEANFAIERLLRLGFLKENSQGNLVDATPNGGLVTNIKDKYTSIASKKFQRQILEKSIEALEHVAIDKRNHTAMTMAVNTKDLSYAFELIKKFRRNMCTEMEASPNPDEIYHLHIGFYPATQRLKTQEESQ